MPIVHVDNIEENQLRFVLTDAVVSQPLATDATFQDVALTLRSLSGKRHGEFISIVAVLKSRNGLDGEASDLVLH